MDLSWALGPSNLLKRAIGRCSYISTAPKPTPEASVSIVSCLSKSGNMSIGGFTIAFFNLLRAYVAAAVHPYESFLSCSVNGCASCA